MGPTELVFVTSSIYIEDNHTNGYTQNSVSIRFQRRVGIFITPEGGQIARKRGIRGS